MARGLGKGLNSLIPKFYDEDFDSNSAKSLEDILNENENNDSTQESTVNDEVNVEDIEESSEENVIVDESNVDDVDGQENQEDDKSKEASDEEIQEENNEDIDSSEIISGDEDTQDDLSNPQEVKKQENVAEVLDIVDKNPRITLWSSRSAAVFRYLRKTEPEFSISREASILIDEAVSKKYPEIWNLFEDLK